MTTAVTVSNLADVLRHRADLQGEAVAALYLGDGGDVKDQVSFGALDLQARAIGARLQGLGAAGECVVLVYTPGLQFLSAFFGCLYANAIPVPLPLPHSKGTVAQFPAIVADLDARILMTTATTMARLRRLELPGLDALITLATEDTEPELARAWRPATPRGTTAYLQYTSGSTANRKGVIITHDNVIVHLLGMAERFRHHKDSVSVNWLPHTHDLGLVSGILQPLFHGHLNVLMSPNAFVQQPIRWLNAVTKYRGTYSNSPNFGYDQCVRRTTPEQRAGLDLSSWEVALNGAEPVHQRTIDEFVAMFEPCGFRRNTMYPAYGLAEATLMVSGAVQGSATVALQVDANALARDRIAETGSAPGARALVACGQAMPQTLVRIIDPVTCEPAADDRVGEIWVRGPGVTAGYWRRPEESEQTFRARVAGDSVAQDDLYLRTGDLGFVRDGNLFITGRWKDLVIIRGANHYPQDIEWTIERSHAAFRPGCGGAFSLDSDDGEQLIAVYEVERDYARSVDPEELARLARRAVAEEHDLHLHTLVLLKVGTVPRTTSGKIQRRKCRSDFLGGELEEIWRSTDARQVVETPASAIDAGTVDPGRPVDDLVAWLREYADHCVNSRLMDQRRAIAPHIVLDFGNRGVLGLQVPPQFGGVGFGFRDTFKVIEQLGAIDQTLTMMAIVHNSLGIWPIMQHAAPALKAELLPKLASGRELVAFAITEPAAGSHPQAIVSRALPDGPDAWTLHGQKSWSGTAGWASVINVFAQNIAPDGTIQGLSGFVVPRDTKGLRIGPEALTLGVRGMVQNTVYLEGARVTRAQCLGEIGGGMKVAQDAMLQGRVAIGAACVGGMKRCLQLLLRYSSRRFISTGRLLDNPVLLERAGDIASALAALESLVYHVAERLDSGAEVPPDALIVCKTAGSEWFWRAADDLVQFLGGRGYIETNLAAQLLRDARVTRILEGPTEALGMYLGSRVVNDGAPLHKFLSDDLSAPAVSVRLAQAAAEIYNRCTSGDRRGDAADARRWAFALIGQIATDAVLLAATPPSANTHRARAEQRFEHSIATALEQLRRGRGMDASELESVVAGYAASIGEIEQSLDGEDDAVDEMLRRGPRDRAPVSPAVVQRPEPLRVEPSPPGPLAAVAAVPPSASVSPAAADAAEVERFIVKKIAAALKMRETSIDPNRSFFDYGLDSVTTVMLTASLEEWLGIDCNPEVVYDIPVIRRFAAHVASRQAAAKCV